MGKKKIVQKTAEEALKETQSAESASVKKASPLTRERYENGKIYIQASYNNTLMTVTDSKGNVITWMSAGSLGFSGPKKATSFAASKVAEAVNEKIQRTGPFNVEILVKGVGSGRDAAIKALISRGLNITSIKDITPVPHNGPRPPKVRRV